GCGRGLSRRMRSVLEGPAIRHVVGLARRSGNATRHDGGGGGGRVHLHRGRPGLAVVSGEGIVDTMVVTEHRVLVSSLIDGDVHELVAVDHVDVCVCRNRVVDTGTAIDG